MEKTVLENTRALLTSISETVLPSPGVCVYVHVFAYVHLCREIGKTDRTPETGESPATRDYQKCRFS